VCFNFLYNFCLKHVSFQKKISKILSKYTQVFTQSTCYYCPILTKLECSPQIFKKSSNIKFHETLFSGSRVVPCEHTHNTANYVWFQASAVKQLRTTLFWVIRQQAAVITTACCVITQNSAILHTANYTSDLQMCLKRHRLYQFASKNYKFLNPHSTT
jgi:hypothetical protein